MPSCRKYDQSVTIQKRTTTNTRGGQPVENWNDHLQRIAEVTVNTTADQVQHDQKTNLEDYSVTMPADSELAALEAKDLRIIWIRFGRQIVLNVKSIDFSGSGKSAEMTMLARKDKA